MVYDNESSVSLFRNKHLLTNIRPAGQCVRVIGIGGGALVVDTCGDFYNLTGVYYHPDAIANILCFYDLTQQFKIEYLL